MGATPLMAALLLIKSLLIYRPLNPKDILMVNFRVINSTHINIFTENHEDDRALYLYKKGKNFYVEQPYIGRWTTSEDLYDMVCSYAEHG